MNTVRVIDLTTVGSLRALEQAGEPGLLRELIDAFLENVPGRLTRIEALAEQGLVAEVEAQAHALAGSCGTLGLEELRVSSREVEKAANTGRIDPPAVAALRPAFARAREALHQLQERTEG